VLAACSGDAPTQVLVHFDLAEGFTVDAAGTMRVDVGDGADTFYGESRLLEAFRFPTTLPVVRGDKSSSERFRIVAELFDGDGTLVSRIDARTSFVPGETRALHLRFYPPCDPVCTEMETCFRDTCMGGCFSSTASDETSESEPTGCADVTDLDGAMEVDGTTPTDGGPDAADGGGCSCPCSTDVCDSGECRPTTSDAVTDVSLGGLHACAVRGNGSIWCWGYNHKGQLGDDSLENRNRPSQAVPYDGPMGPAKQVEASQASHTCAVTEDGKLWCWGSSGAAVGNTHELYRREDCTLCCDWYTRMEGDQCVPWYGDPIMQPVFFPARGETIRSVFLGRSHTCARVFNGTDPRTLCMGGNEDGQLARDPLERGGGSSLEHSIGGNVSDTRAEGGEDHNCVIREGDVRCWGKNSAGQLGSMPMNAYRPTVINDGALGVSTWLEVGLGWDHSCAISDAGGLYCWGDGGQGRLGNGETGDTSTPTLIDPGPGWTVVNGGRTHTCGIRGGALLCWGSNGAGELGDGSRLPHMVPEQVGTEADWELVSAGDIFTCGVRGGGQLYCWGTNEVGQLGIGSETNSLEPTRVCFP